MMGENENNLEDNIIKTSINISKNINEGNIKNNNKIINDSIKEENQQKIEQILSKEENNIEKKLNEENKSNYNDKSNKNNDSKQTNNPNETILKLNENNINNSDLEKDSDILSLEEFKKLYNQLHLIITQNKKLDKIIQEISTILECITEHLINGDKKNTKIFGLFNSLNTIHDLRILMNKKNREVNIQIIKFFSVLMTNLSEKYLSYFLFNCDFINKHIYEDNEPINGDYLYYYISFVKSLMLKINSRTIGYFYHAQTYSFPLLGNCLKFYNHPDSMISNTIRNIFLFILKMKYSPSIDYICSLPMLTYFIFISCRLRDEIKILNKKIIRNKEEECMMLQEEIINDIMYIQDIFSINIEKVNFILINCIFHYIILPVICNSLINQSDLDGSFNINKDSRALSMNEKKGNFNFFNYDNDNNKVKHKNNNPLLKFCISSELTIYILNIFIKYIKNETFINLLLSLLFFPKIHCKILNKLNNSLKDLDNYHGDYNNNSKKKITFEKYIIENFCPSFIIAQIDNQNKTFSELKKIEKKLIEKCKSNNINFNLFDPIPYEYLMELLYSYFSNRGLRECREYHEIVSESTGIQCGLSYHSDRKCFIYLMNKSLKYINNNDISFEIINKKYIDNEIYSCFINLYKDNKDIFLLLSDFLFHQIITNNLVSKELLSYIMLLNPNEINKNITNKIQEEISSNISINEIIKSNETKKEKNNFNEVLTFSNIHKVMYLNDFIIKDYNLYDNIILSKILYNKQTEYNSALLGDTISYLNRDNLLKPEAYLFIARLINDLIVYEYKDQKKLLKLRGIHKSIFKNAFIKNIKNIKNKINSDKVNDNDLKMIFIFLWGNYSKLDCFDDYDRMITNIMKDCSILLPKEDDEEEDDDNNGTLIAGFDIFNSLLINDLDLRIRIYFLKCMLKIYNGIYERKEIDIKIKELNEENKDNIKNIMNKNFDKLIFKENIK